MRFDGRARVDVGHPLLSELIRNPCGGLLQRLDQAEPDTIGTSNLVACELRFGTPRKGSDALTQRVERLLSSLSILAFDEPATTSCASSVEYRACASRTG